MMENHISPPAEWEPGWWWNSISHLHQSESQGDDDGGGGWGATRHHRASWENPGYPVGLKQRRTWWRGKTGPRWMPSAQYIGTSQSCDGKATVQLLYLPRKTNLRLYSSIGEDIMTELFIQGQNPEWRGRSHACKSLSSYCMLGLCLFFKPIRTYRKQIREIFIVSGIMDTDLSRCLTFVTTAA